ncbi:MAG: hypothetical protein H6741_00580 [Alphaproteobacteria bacterium]|nr:hypothetical protein [Alphaproteobacteria bacterium]MCB9791200.1 hypothetical protein [Alphaproteobacteria bacterium]
MPLSSAEYACLRDFSVLYSGGLDSCAVPIIVGENTRGGIHLLTFKHGYGTLFNEWSRKHTPELQRVLGQRVQHHIIDLTAEWNAIGAKRFVQDTLRYQGHWVICLGCQEAMATNAIIYNLERNITNTLICSSVGGEYAVMSMPITRMKNIEFYKRFGIRYNAPLLDMGIGKPEEREVLRRHGIDPGWGARRSHQGYQPICLVGFQHSLDIVFDAHTTYPPEKVAEFLEDKFRIMERVIRETLLQRGHDPDALIARNLAVYEAEEAAMAEVRERALSASISA